mmetsp:Transcript_9625/g.32073  ORF Transcript_9625/g.32073 Transcript_9625/m.32073 type:complete len:250 (-) Transcript_9625:360-1109(-)
MGARRTEQISLVRKGSVAGGRWRSVARACARAWGGAGQVGKCGASVQKVWADGVPEAQSSAAMGEVRRAEGALEIVEGRAGRERRLREVEPLEEVQLLPIIAASAAAAAPCRCPPAAGAARAAERAASRGALSGGGSSRDAAACSSAWTGDWASHAGRGTGAAPERTVGRRHSSVSGKRRASQAEAASPPSARASSCGSSGAHAAGGEGGSPSRPRQRAATARACESVRVGPCSGGTAPPRRETPSVAT